MNELVPSWIMKANRINELQITRGGGGGRLPRVRRSTAAEFPERIPENAQGAIKLIEAERKANKVFIDRFAAFAEICRESINARLTDQRQSRRCWSSTCSPSVTERRQQKFRAPASSDRFAC